MFLAAYRGDTFICLADNYEEMAKKLGVSVRTAKWLGYKSVHSRENRRKLVYEYED